MTELNSWRERPADLANLLNPAYCTILLKKMCDGFQSKPSAGMPYVLAFVGLPLVLHRTSAELLPSTARTKLPIWLHQNPELLFDFGARAIQLAPYIREAISYGLSHRALHLTERGELVGAAIKGLKGWEEAPPPRTAVKQAALVGKLLATVNDVATIFAMFGVRT